jgi:dihydropyrimidinase
MVVTGWPVLTFLRGRVIAENGRFVGQPGQGRFIGRQRRQPL